MAQQGINQLRSSHGIEPTLDEIIWLHELGKVQEAAGRVDGILEAPAQAGDAFLWPMTIMAAEWYRNTAMPWFAASPMFSFYALAFALAHGRGLAIPDTKPRGWVERIVRQLLDLQEGSILPDLLDRDTAMKAIKAWVKATHATKEELEAAVDFVLPTPEPEKPKKGEPEEAAPIGVPPGVNFDQVVHELATLSGTDPDYWRSKTSKDMALCSYMNVVAIERARRNQSGASVRDNLAEAIQRFQMAIFDIIQSRTTEPPQEATQ